MVHTHRSNTINSKRAHDVSQFNVYTKVDYLKRPSIKVKVVNFHCDENVGSGVMTPFSICCNRFGKKYSPRLLPWRRCWYVFSHRRKQPTRLRWMKTRKTTTHIWGICPFSQGLILNKYNCYNIWISFCKLQLMWSVFLIRLQEVKNSTT